MRRKTQKYQLLQSVSLDFANKFEWTVWLLTNGIFHIQAGTLKCKILNQPDWLK